MEFLRKVKGGPNRLLYLLFDEGVNCGIANRTQDPEHELHPEFGHIRPQIHLLDTDGRTGFRPEAHSGCPAHDVCFEGIASLGRIQKSWGGVEILSASSRKGDRAREIISFYMAQAVMTGMLAATPDVVRIGGSLIYGNKPLLKMVRDKVVQLNNGYLPWDVQQRIGMAHFGPDVRVRGALYLAKYGSRRRNSAEVETLRPS